MKKLNIKTTIRHASGVYTLSFHKRNDIKKFSEYIYKDNLDLKLNRKYDKFIYLNSLPQRNKSSKYIGVSYNKNFINKKWTAYIRVDGKTKYIGLYNTEDEAFNARQQFIIN